MHKFKDLLYSNWEDVVTVAGKRRNGFIQGRHELSCYYCGRKVKTGRRFDAKGPIVLGGDFCNMDRRICAFPRTGRREFGLASPNGGGLVWKGRVLVASVDGRLHALDAGSGKELWVADTIVDHALHSSAAPFTSRVTLL